jgi:hypothetical protein
MVNAPVGIHGVTEKSEHGVRMAISLVDDDERQLEALIHEHIHAQSEEDTWSPQAHPLVKRLAVELNQRVFPHLLEASEGGGKLFFDAGTMRGREITLLDASEAAVAQLANRGAQPIPGGLERIAGPGLVMTPSGRVTAAKRYVSPQLEKSIRAKWGGWATKYLLDMYKAQVFVWPITGIIKATPLHQIREYSARDAASFFAELMSSLASKDLRTTKLWDTSTAAGGSATVTDPGAVSSIGLLHAFTDVKDLATNEPFTVTHFTAAGSQNLPYVIYPDGSGPAIWLALHVLDAQGKGIVSARDDLESTIADGAIRAGSRFTSESVNLFDLQF